MTDQNIEPEIFHVGEQVWWYFPDTGYSSKVIVVAVQGNTVSVANLAGVSMNFIAREWDSFHVPEPEVALLTPRSKLTHEEPPLEHSCVSQ
jgi:hypothetical protein